MWKQLKFVNGSAANLDIVISRIRALADTTIDMGAIIGGILLPGTISERVLNVYDEILFSGATLQDLPDDANGPRFVINATNVQSAALWRFSKPYMGDYRVGLIDKPAVSLAAAVAASSAFPPFLSPSTINLRQPVKATAGADLCRAPYTATAVLSDGGVYDNLGLETAIKRYTTLLVSDAGQKIAAEEEPHHDWARHAVRILDTVDNQVRSLRKRYLIESYQRGDHKGCYWGIRTSFADYQLGTDPLGCGARDAIYLAEIPTRLERMPRPLQDKLINWGYAICDAALRRHMDSATQAHFGVSVAAPKGFPFDGGY